MIKNEINDIKDINNINWNEINDNDDIKDFRNFFKGQCKICKVVSIIDGDTIKVLTDINNEIWKVTVRLAHIDTPELHSQNIIEKERAFLIKNILENKILNKVVTIKFDGPDKFSRSLGNIYLNEENINTWLLDNNYAVKYEGKKKVDWSTIL
jgi:endonuclease YncB( thermonuclease family)